MPIFIHISRLIFGRINNLLTLFNPLKKLYISCIAWSLFSFLLLLSLLLFRVIDFGDDNVPSGESLCFHTLPHHLRCRVAIKYQWWRASRVLILSESADIGDHSFQLFDSEHFLRRLFVNRIIHRRIGSCPPHGRRRRAFSSSVIRGCREQGFALVGIVWQGTVARWDGFQAWWVGTHVICRNGISIIIRKEKIRILLQGKFSNILSPVIHLLFLEFL